MSTTTHALQATIGGATRLICIVGDPVAQVKSPHAWNPKLAAAGRDAVLIPLHIRTADFDDTIEAIMRVANMDGLVFTMPFKEQIIPYLASISLRATQVGAVNVARRSDAGLWVGDMFDGVGLVGAARGLGIEPKGLRVGLLGAGGAGSAIAFALAESGVTSLAVFDASSRRSELLVGRVTEASPGCEVTSRRFQADEVDLLVNATPIGMTEGDGVPIDVTSLNAATSVIDIVTRPTTPLLEAAAAAGCRHTGGASMVAAQTDAILTFLGLADVG